MRVLGWVAMAALFAAGTLPAMAAETDIVGLRFGMSPDQARAAIKAHQPGMEFYDIKKALTRGAPPRFYFTEAVMPSSNLEKFGVEFAADGSGALFIQRSHNPDKADLPDAAKVEAAIVAKYGPPSHREEAGVGQPRLRWLWRPDGRLVPLKTLEDLRTRKCNPQRGKGGLGYQLSGTPGPDCGTLLEVIMATHQGRMTHLSLTMANFPRIEAERVLRESGVDAGAKAQGKPKL